MATIICLAIAFSIPFLFVRIFCNNEHTVAGKLLFFGLGAFVALCFYAFAVLFLSCIAAYDYQDDVLESVYESDAVEVTSFTKSKASIIIGDDNLDVGRSTTYVSTSSDNPDIQDKLNQGKTVVETYKAVSPKTLFVTHRYRIYTPPENAELYSAWTYDEDAREDDD